jgi:hypothetical protein
VCTDVARVFTEALQCGGSIFGGVQLYNLPSLPIGLNQIEEKHMDPNFTPLLLLLGNTLNTAWSRLPKSEPLKPKRKKKRRKLAQRFWAAFKALFAAS